MPVHVVQLSTQKEFYGGEVHLRDLAAALRERGHRVTGVVRPGSGLARRLPEAGVQVVTVPLVDWFEPVGMVRLARALRTLRPDVLHVHTPRDYYVAAVATLGTSICSVATRHQLRPIALPALKRPFLARMQAIIAVSQAVRDGLLATGLPTHRLVTVPNGIAPPAVVLGREEARRELGLEPDAPTVGFVGRLCVTKGVEVLLHAVARLRARWPRLQVALVGGDAAAGPTVAELRELADRRQLADTVHFAGYRPDAGRLCPAFDVLAVPSRAEPFGLVTLEALVRGVPVVATSSGGSREIVRDGAEGFLVEPDDAAALARALDRVLNDPGLRERLGAAGRRRVLETFTLERQVTATERVYQLASAGQVLPARLPADGRAGLPGLD